MKQAIVGPNGRDKKHPVLRIAEMFTSINGEVNFRHQGSIAHFVRLAGCNIKKCSWCDTKFALNEEDFPWYTVETVINHIPPKDQVPNITITGGEPLIQEEPLMFMIEILAKSGYFINIETNGTLPVPRFPHKLRSQIGWTIDLKMPSSGRYTVGDVQNLPKDMSPNDWIKFVIANGMDFAKAIYVIEAYDLKQYNIAFSPVLRAGIQSKLFIDRVIEKGRGYGIISLQLHKMIGMK